MNWMRTHAAKLKYNSRFVLASVVLMSASLSAQANLLERFVEGKHYQRLAKPVKTQDPTKIEVVEVFSYLCPHCYSLEPTLRKWQQTLPNDVLFARKHAQFNRQYLAYAKLHVTLQLLGIEDQVHEAIFKSIHEQKSSAFEPEDQYDLVKEAGVKQEAFLSTFDSFAHKIKLKQTEKDMIAYQISGVPAMIVNGKYRLSETSAGSRQSLIELTDFLIEIERGQRSSANTAVKQ